MLVRRSNFEQVVVSLRDKGPLSIDTETTGLRPYHGDKLFSIIIADEIEAYYFNFQNYPGLDSDLVLNCQHLQKMQGVLFDNVAINWFLQNAKFDMHMLWADSLEIKGPVMCTRAVGRIEYNAHMTYTLASQLKRIGLAKSEAAAEFVKANKLFTKVQVPGKSKIVEYQHYDRIPFDIISKYGEIDGTGTRALGMHQLASINGQDKASPTGRSLANVVRNESRLTKTVFRMERAGCRADIPYCKRAAQFESDRASDAARKFKSETGKEYAASPKLFGEVFASEKNIWEYTEKNNPSFESDTLKKFTNPAAKLVLTIRDAKSKSDFYSGFLYHADAAGFVHPNFNPDGTVHGRMSSSEPNFQNLTNEDSDEEIKQEFIVRRAIIPREGRKLFSIDYSAMEYKFMLEMACILLKGISPLASMVRDGHDVHEATAQLVQQTTGIKITRRDAKICNFLTLYGGGIGKLAESLNVSLEQAKIIRGAIFTAAPEIRAYTSAIARTAEERGYIINWLGRRCHFENRSFSYKAPNYHISGGCADVVKVAMNRIDDRLLQGAETIMTMAVHDELVFDTPPNEEDLILEFKNIMENVYPAKYLPLNCSMSSSEKSLGDLQ